jgi:hypothetical protein
MGDCTKHIQRSEAPCSICSDTPPHDHGTEKEGDQLTHNDSIGIDSTPTRETKPSYRDTLTLAKEASEVSFGARAETVFDFSDMLRDAAMAIAGHALKSYSFASGSREYIQR